MSRHQRYQLLVSLGLVAAAGMSSLIPDMNHVSTIIAMSTNLVWLWEPSR